VVTTVFIAATVITAAVPILIMVIIAFASD
jgi:hypothetical protein